MNFSCFLINVYGPNLAVEKCKLWEDISKRLEEVRLSLAIVVGDFNATLSFLDKRGGVRRLYRSQSDFQSFVNANVLFEVEAKGGNFTWTNRRRGFSNITEKLDRFFLVGDWNLAPVDPLVFEAEVLAISGSDHFLVSLVVQKDEIPIREVFGNIFDEKRRLEGDLGALNAKVLAEGMDEVDFLIEKYLLSKYGEVLQKEEIYWKQKLRENWLKAGDRNAKFFHSSAELLELIPPLVSREDNIMLEEPVSLKEVKSVVFGLGGEKALGPDEFQAFFFQFFWDVLGEELLAVIEESRSRGFVLKEFNCTLVALIPKKAKLEGMEEFRPISLCNTIYKIIKKVAANRLKLILGKLISCEHSGFTPGRNIVDGVIVAHEAIHTFSASVLVNGSPQGFFSTSRASMHEASAMKKVLNRFSWATGQEINWLKLEIFFFCTECWSQRAIARLFGIKIGQLPGKFLGMPLFSGASKSDIWKGLLDGCKAKMEVWKSKWLSLAGRLLMLKLVVSAMSIFPMACFKLPGSIIKNMQQKMRVFVEWKSGTGQNSAYGLG
ncbi:uncharacterized protein LOC131066016 [Cryptomeria japonica]|uniref:uncharacterized protein LOC131066016 n=1 Tax=Cryptomeria japonica TaxID=3369 RepID=UPI0027DA80B5|nr:uncharacterized protein LOC131066016 [Cryptomeria japonica]